MPAADHRYENNMKKTDWKEILNALSTAGFVRLDQDRIYLSHQTEHWTYNSQNDNLTIVKISGSPTYKAIPVTNIGISSGEHKKGIFFLNSDNSSDPYYKKYIRITSNLFPMIPLPGLYLH